MYEKLKNALSLFPKILEEGLRENLIDLMKVLIGNMSEITVLASMGI